MSNTNIKAILLRVHSDHNIRCSATQEKKLVTDLNRLWEASDLSRGTVADLISRLPTSFLSENRLDSAAQYTDLLWDALSADAKDLESTHSTSITHFHAPVQTQILQTGAGSKANISQRSQQNVSYSQAMGRALKDIREAVDVEIVSEPDRTEAKALVADVEKESSKPNPDQGKIKKCLKALGKWTGERLNSAVDAAIEVGVEYALKGGAP